MQNLDLVLDQAQTEAEALAKLRDLQMFCIGGGEGMAFGI